jgi:hypothetical protein
MRSTRRNYSLKPEQERAVTDVHAAGITSEQ